MKVFKKIIAWAMLSIIVQVAGLYILDRFVFRHTSEFESKKLDIKKEITKDIKASIPNKAKNVSISYDGKYLTYELDEELYLEDTATGTSNKLTTESKGAIMYCDWLQERDILVIAEKTKKSGDSKIQVITYNVRNSTESLVKEIC